MTTISIKDVPDEWAEVLRRRAARNHRSLQGELMAILEQSLGVTVGPAADDSKRGQARRGPPGYRRRAIKFRLMGVERSAV